MSWEAISTIAAVIFSSGVLYAHVSILSQRVKRIENILDELVNAYLKNIHSNSWDGIDRRKRERRSH